MQEFAVAFVLMAISAFVSIQVGQRKSRSKTFVYVLGMVALLAQIGVLFAVRDMAPSGGHQLLVQTGQSMGHAL